MYFFFQIYFDWMDHEHLKGLRQLTWTIFHFPFHVALLLFMEGSTQFMMWWKAVSGVLSSFTGIVHYMLANYSG
jgi:hypothetical protein